MDCHLHSRSQNTSSSSAPAPDVVVSDLSKISPPARTTFPHIPASHRWISQAERSFPRSYVGTKVSVVRKIGKKMIRANDWVRFVAQVGEWDVNVAGYGLERDMAESEGVSATRSTMKCMDLYRERRLGRGRRISSWTHWSREIR